MGFIPTLMILSADTSLFGLMKMKKKMAKMSSYSRRSKKNGLKEDLPSMALPKYLGTGLIGYSESLTH